MTIEKYDARSHMTILTVLVFGPESVSYESSRRETAAKFHHFSARVFFVKISKSQDSRIYTISRFFRVHIPKMDSFPMLCRHPTRPPGRPPARPPGHPKYKFRHPKYSGISSETQSVSSFTQSISSQSISSSTQSTAV